MNFVQFFYTYFNNTDALAKLVLLVTLVMYNFFALALAFQIFTYNRFMIQVTFAPIFKFIAVLHVVLSFILLLALVFLL